MVGSGLTAVSRGVLLWMLLIPVSSTVVEFLLVLSALRAVLLPLLKAVLITMVDILLVSVLPICQFRGLILRRSLLGLVLSGKVCER